MVNAHLRWTVVHVICKEGEVWMRNREKIINRLEIQLEDLKKYADNDQPLSLTQEQAQEIIAILKEQNNIGHLVILENCSNAGVYCSKCQTKIFDHYPIKKKYSYFCPHCGTRIEGLAALFR